MSKKISFCFSGDGSRGSIQQSCAKMLYDKGITADFTIGTSSGSCCAALYSYAGPEKAVEMWNSVKNIFTIFRINWNFLWNTGFLNQKPAEKLIKKYIKGEPFCEGVVLTMHIETGEMKYVSNKDVSADEFAEWTLRSFAITGMCSDRDGWVDAGSRQMTPLQQCIDAGCDEIYVILGRPFGMAQWKKPNGLLKIAGMGFRALDISLMELMLRDIKSCLKKNGEPGYRGIKIHIMEPKIEYYNSILFRKCRDGVKYGLDPNNWNEIHETALRKMVGMK